MKRIFAWIFAITMLVAVTGCQKTPESPIVADKNMENMIQAAEEPQSPGTQEISVREKVGAPDRMEYDATQGKLNIVVNADVFIPETNKMPIINVKSGVFSQETVDEYWDTLIGDAQMWEWSEQPTKADLEEMIIYQKQVLTETQQNEDGESIKLLNDALAELERMHEAAPETTISVLSDGKLKEQVYWDPVSAKIDTRYTGMSSCTVKNNIEMMNAAWYQWFSVSNPWTGAKGSIKPYEGPAQLRYNTAALNRNYSYGSGALIDEDDVPDEAIRAVLKMTPKEAKETVEAFFTKVRTPMEVYNIRIMGNKVNLDGKKKAAEYYAYEMECIRITDGGLPAANVRGTGYEMFQRGFIPPQGMKVTDMTGYAKPWHYESMSVTLDDNGIISLDWFAPLEILNTEVEDSKLLPFEDIKAVFEKMMPITYETGIEKDYTMTCDISNVRLEMMRVRKQNSDQNALEGLLIPVWNFYGVLSVYNSNGELINGNMKAAFENTILSINAIDGTIINTSKGY